jgi:hypothetical protein
MIHFQWRSESESPRAAEVDEMEAGFDVETVTATR